MKNSSKIILFLILFLFLIGCKAESPSTGSSDNSSSTSTSNDTNTGDTGTGTTSYVGKWITSDNIFGLDWKSDSFIYACAYVNNITLAAHGSYSSSNSRLTWWEGSYDTVTSSGSNIIVGSDTYVPAVLYANCNPFWTYHTSENTSYTNLAKSIGYWSFTYTISNTYTDKIRMVSITSAQNTTDFNYITAGLDAYGNAVVGSYNTSTQIYDILDSSLSSYNEYYTFYLNSSYSGISAGCYYLYSKSSSPTTCVTITSGTKSYGTPRSYRIISEGDIDKIALQKQKAKIALMNQSSNNLTEQDINAHKRYLKLLQVQNSIDRKPLKRFLQTFRSK